MSSETEKKEQQLLLRKRVLVIGQDSSFREAVIKRSEEEGAIVFGEIEQIDGRVDIIVNLTGRIQETTELLSKAQEGDLVNDGGSIINLVFDPKAIFRFSPTDKVQDIAIQSGGVSELGKVYAESLGNRRVRVNTLLVGPVDTPDFWGLLRKDIDQKTILATRCLHKIPKAEDISSAVVFFASDKSSYITGTVFPIEDLRK